MMKPKAEKRLSSIIRGLASGKLVSSKSRTIHGDWDLKLVYGFWAGLGRLFLSCDYLSCLHAESKRSGECLKCRLYVFPLLPTFSFSFF